MCQLLVTNSSPSNVKSLIFLLRTDYVLNSFDGTSISIVSELPFIVAADYPTHKIYNCYTYQNVQFVSHDFRMFLQFGTSLTFIMFLSLMLTSMFITYFYGPLDLHYTIYLNNFLFSQTIS